ncbi:hypothetical protein PCASD_09364 [Puccinia coronata f. sp. avenae]|uniref:DUF6589 domain-containing protein n=1 Tax=Puccinia coronata f. sp. avenae TaxID=200324 RepID=A0A2N5V1A3_9BASI|nr:hypothetical protein PCASD_09364 [Puccinia coronata f. sp. avenae]
MPFLYQLLYAKLQGKEDSMLEEEDSGEDDDGKDDEEEVCDEVLTRDFVALDKATPEGAHLNHDCASLPPKDRLTLSEKDVNEFKGGFLARSSDPKDRRKRRMARSICAMVAFGANRRHNGFQLSNSLIFIACGVSERVNAYLNYLGLCSSRKTAHIALRSLGREAEAKLVNRFSLASAPFIGPNICYDNLDFQQKVHMKSVGHSSVMFHGTWGYIHSIPPSVLPSLNPAELSIDALNNALHAASKLTIRPAMFGPTMASITHFKQVIKSQIAQVVLQYFAEPLDSKVSINCNPPPVTPLKPELPNISMLKLMVASDNSAAGVGEVFTGLLQQTGLTAEQFHSRLQLIEGDLGSCLLFESLRNQRVPARRHATALDNVLAIPGAAHTLWNMAQAIFLAHWGNEKHARDTGAWRSLHGLGIPADKPVTKKDFNLMLSHIEKVHEATLLYCALVVFANNDKNKDIAELGPKPLKLSSATIHKLVNDTYDRFCSGKARRSDLAQQSPTHSNMLLRIRDFATVIEAHRAMKAGDPGRLMYMWRCWSVMGQGIPKLPHYSKHLPRLVLLLEHFLTLSQAKVVQSTLLISPTGRAGHFVATDFFLEVQNYWLKYFFNHSGIGTEINRLKDVFSINIPIVSS